ncbi:hypothetical protein Leryth_022978 [Lithospermum erythrorhizon]|nr:hypothetical protein Leryth_022978 [Lithospermum erythrorhizon]
MSIINIAREYGLQSLSTLSDDADACAVCLERACAVAAEGCEHELCVRCALYLCSTSNRQSEVLGPPGSIPCPLCRHGIVSFIKLPGSSTREIKLPISLSFCTPCMLHPREQEDSTPGSSHDIRKNREASIPSDLFCPITCSPFPSVGIPLCTCNDGTCQILESRHRDNQEESPDRSTVGVVNKTGDRRGWPETTCSSMFWSRRSCSREHQCNAEINA